MTRPRPGRRRQRGAIDELPSGALRVRVYAGEDPLTGKRHSLVEIIPPGPKAATLAEAARTRMLSQVDERRNPRTSAALDQLLDRHLETLDVGRTTRRMYAKYLEKHVRPFVGRLKAGVVDAEVPDSLYGAPVRHRSGVRLVADTANQGAGSAVRVPQRRHRIDLHARPAPVRPRAGSG